MNKIMYDSIMRLINEKKISKTISIDSVSKMQTNVIGNHWNIILKKENADMSQLYTYSVYETELNKIGLENVLKQILELCMCDIIQ